MKRILLASLCIFAVVGCAGDKALTPSPFTGSYTGAWVNVADDTDAGTSLWTISSDGTVVGTDTDVDTNYSIVGNVAADGTFTSTSTSDISVPMNGTAAFDANGRLILNVVWQGTPPETYRYTLNRQ